MNTVSDILTTMRNAMMAEKKTAKLRKSNMALSILEILKNEGFIKDFTSDDRSVEVSLLYEKGEPAISSLEMVSRPGQQIYVCVSDIKPVLQGRGVGIISTSKGIMTLEDAKKENLGGEYICKIW